MFSPRIIQGMMGGRGLGMACGHIKAFVLFPFSHQRKISAEGLQGRHALSMLGRTLRIVCNIVDHIVTTILLHAQVQ